MAKSLKPFQVTLRSFLEQKNLPSALNLPWVHSASASKLMDIAQAEKLLAMPCNVFKGEKLCYFFVGRPAYKFKSTPTPSPWQLPVAFVVRFHKPPPIKRIFPFDSGAFKRDRLPDYITMFNIDGYDLASNSDLVGRLVSFYFKTPARYFSRSAVGEEELKEEHSLDMSHAEVMALGRLFGESSSTRMDDRAAAIELQVAQDIPLAKDNLLGVVIPSEYARTDGVLNTLRNLTSVIETYDLLPLSTDHHFALVYDRVKAIYNRAGIKA